MDGFTDLVTWFSNLIPWLMSGLPNLLWILVTASLTTLISYYFEKRREWKLLGLGERLKAYRILYSFCSEILDRNDEVESENLELLRCKGDFVHENRTMPWNQWESLPLPSSYKEVKQYLLTQWFAYVKKNIHMINMEVLLDR